MKIAVLGATGMAGSAITHEAVARGHAVVAVARRPKSEDPAQVTAVAADVSNRDAVAEILRTADVAVLTVRPAPGSEDQLPALTRSVLDAAHQTGTRLLVVGGSAPLRSPSSSDILVIDEPRYVPAEYQPSARASLAQFKVCQEHPHRDWVYFSPPALFQEGPRTGHYQRGTDTLLVNADGRSEISAADFAIAVVDHLEQPTDEHHVTAAW